MKTKSKNTATNRHSKLNPFFTSGTRFCFYVFCLLLAAFYILPPQSIAQNTSEQLDPLDILIDKESQLAKQIQNEKPRQQLQTMPDSIESVPANFVTQVVQELPQADFIYLQDNIKRRLWQARISPPIYDANSAGTSKNELQQIIKQISSVKFEPEKKPQPIISVEPAAKAEPNKIAADTEPPKEYKIKQLPYNPITDITLENIKNLSQHPEQADNPFELAEILFLSGRPKDAAAFYQEAINRTSADKTDAAENRAWILCQIANCLQDDDPAAALKIYRQLITEYPNSPWTDLAKAREKLIDWYQKDKPEALITNATK
jgi:tetratricopeptide (TPR) repeat protein